MVKLQAIINPAAGQDEPVLAVLDRVFKRFDVRYDVRITQEEGDAERFAREALDGDFDCIAAYGGDGTVSSIAAALVGSDVPLAVLPGGTGNSIAQELGIPVQLEAAVTRACEALGDSTPVDGYVCRDRFGLLRVGVGADARMVKEASREQKDRWGWGAYLMAAVAQFREARRGHFTLALDDRELSVDALTCLVLNMGRVGRGGLSFGSEITPHDGLLDVLVIRDADFGAAAAMGARMLGLQDAGPATLDETQPVLHFQARNVEVRTESPEEVHCDGEVVPGTPVRIEVVPAALRILLPSLPA